MITNEVIPFICKRGAYVVDSVLNQIEVHTELIAGFIQQLREENAEAKRNRELLEQARAENERLASKAGYYDHFVSADDLTCLGNCPDLFADSEYVGNYYGTEYEKDEIPPEALESSIRKVFMPVAVAGFRLKY